MREMLVGRFWWCCGRATLDETLGGVRSTSWIWPGERPGNANNDLVGLGDKAHKPGLVTSGGSRRYLDRCRWFRRCGACAEDC